MEEVKDGLIETEKGQNISYVGVEETVDGIEQLDVKEAKLDVQEDSVVDLTFLLS